MTINDLYANLLARIDTIIGSDNLAPLRLHRAFNHYKLETQDHSGALSFKDHLIEQYGILIEYDSDQNIKIDYQVVDQQKYTVFLLKFS